MSKENATDRRSFLKLASVGAAGAVVATAGAQSAQADASQSGDSAGYSETDHVKKVYELARF